MKKYIDLIAHPIMLGAVYVLLGFINWSSDPGMWPWSDRVIWVCWGLAWGWMLQSRIKRGVEA